jgi:hypothetical protein
MAARKTAQKKGQQSKQKGPGKVASKRKAPSKATPKRPPEVELPERMRDPDVQSEGKKKKQAQVKAKRAASGLGPRRRDRLAGGGKREETTGAKKKKKTSLEKASHPGVGAALPHFANH